VSDEYSDSDWNDDERLDDGNVGSATREFNLTISREYIGDESFHFEAELSEWEGNTGGILIANGNGKTAEEAAIDAIKKGVYDFED